MKNSLFPLLVRFTLGVVFLYASLDKIIHPGAFAQTVYHYQAFPNVVVNLTAIILPWLEVVLGLSLISGVWLPGAVFLSNITLSVFLVLLLSVIWRGLNIDCGCFVAARESGASLSMWWYVLRDGVFLALALYLMRILIRQQRKEPEEDAGAS